MQKIEATVKAQAKELAGAFYETNRTDKFRRAFPTVRHFMLGSQAMYDNKLNFTHVRKVPAGWTHFIVLARKTLSIMLGQPDARISPQMKERIFDALLEDRENTNRPGVQRQRISQRTSFDG
jgi:hypothetical protein